MTETHLSLALFAVAAVVGLIMAARLFAQKAPPVIFPVLHGLFGVAGVATLFLAIRAGGAPPYAMIALGVFLIAALGGLFLVSFQLRGKFPPRAVIVLHGAVAASGFALLAASALGVT